MSGTNYIASNWRTPENSNSSKNDNYSLSFDGTTSYIDCGIIPPIETQTWSLSTWVKWNSLTGSNETIFSTRQGGLASSTGFDLYITDSGGNLRARTYKGNGIGAQVIISTSTYGITTGVWYNIVCTYNSGTLTVSINDGAVFSGSASGNYTPSSVSGYIGKWRNGAGDHNGEISELAVFDYILDSNQITTLYGDTTSGAGNPMALKPTPIAYYPLGDNSASDPLAQPNVAVEDASVFNFDGVDDYVEIPNITPRFGTQNPATPDSATNAPWSVSIWAYIPSGLTTTTPLFNIPLGSSVYSWKVIWGASQIIQFGARYRTLRVNEVTTAINTNQWNHIVVTFDGVDTDALTSWKLFINGVNITNLTSGGHLGTNGTGKTYIARDQSNYGEVKIDELSLYDIKLTDSNVTDIYNSGVPGDISSLNPLAWWKLDESANWEADTAGTWQIPDAVSEFPQSFAFDGSNDYIETTKTAALTTASLSMWVKVSGNFGVNERQSLASNDDFNHGRDFIIADSPTTTNDAYIGMFAGGIIYGKTSASGGIPINDGNWHHLVWTYDGSAGTSASINMYVDGQNQYSNATYSSYWSYEIKFQYFGKPIAASNYFAGKVSNVQTWDVALAPEKVTTLYNGGTPTLTPPNQSDLKAWYKLDNTEVFDGSNWSLQNQVYPANYESALDFDGSSDYINAGASTLSGETALSISAWVKPTAYGSAAAESFVSTDAASPRAFYLGLFNGTNFRFSLSTNGTALTSLDTAAGTVDLNVWQHILVTWDQVNLKLYKNGVLLKTVATTSSSNGTFTTTNNLLIGARRPSAGFFNGEISNVAIFDSALDLSAAQSIYNNGTPETNISNLPVSWWKLNNITTGIRDNVGSNNGTNNGATKINTFVSNEIGTSTGLVEQSLVNNNVSTLNGESSGMTSGNLVLSDLTRNLPYENYSLQFDGTADYIDCSNISGLNGGLTEATWSGWFNRGGTGAYYLMSTWGTSNPKKQFGVLQSATAMSVYMANSVGSQSTMNQITYSFSVDTWYHLAFVYDESESNNADKMKVYVNGVLQTNNLVGAALTTLNSTTQNFEIGKLGGYTTNEFNGKISNVAIWNNGLSSTEVQNLYANGIPQDLTTFTPQPINWWTLGKESFWDGSDWVIRDMIGTNDGLSDNMGGSELTGDAPRSQANGVGTNIAVPTDLKGEAGWSDKNGYSINMSSTARTTDTP